MPTYEYECKHCKYTFEEFQRITAEPLKECPSCGKEVRRLLGTGAGIIFKGSGFYSTDYRSSSYDKDKKKAEEKPAKKESGDTKKKPAKTKKESGKSKGKSAD